MDIQVISSSQGEEKLSFKKTDISTLYIVQHEIQKNPDVDFAGVIVKHPLTNECWMRLSSKSDPRQNLSNATENAVRAVNDMRNALNADIST